MSFHPMYTEAESIDRANGLAKRLTVPVVFPSGIGAGAGDVSVSSVDNGNVLYVEYIWPDPLSNATKASFYHSDAKYLARLNSYPIIDIIILRCFLRIIHYEKCQIL